MTPPADLSESACVAYAAGIDPLDHAEHEITTLIGIHRQLAAFCPGPRVTPSGDLSEGALSRRILGCLLG